MRATSATRAPSSQPGHGYFGLRAYLTRTPLNFMCLSRASVCVLFLNYTSFRDNRTPGPASRYATNVAEKRSPRLTVQTHTWSAADAWCGPSQRRRLVPILVPPPSEGEVQRRDQLLGSHYGYALWLIAQI